MPDPAVQLVAGPQGRGPVLGQPVRGHVEVAARIEPGGEPPARRQRGQVQGAGWRCRRRRSAAATAWNVASGRPNCSPGPQYARWSARARRPAPRRPSQHAPATASWYRSVDRVPGRRAACGPAEHAGDRRARPAGAVYSGVAAGAGRAHRAHPVRGRGDHHHRRCRRRPAGPGPASSRLRGVRHAELDPGDRCRPSPSSVAMVAGTAGTRLRRLAQRGGQDGARRCRRPRAAALPGRGCPTGRPAARRA